MEVKTTQTKSTNVPEGFKQTEVGVIPEDWEVVRIGEITTTSAGGTPSTKEQSYWGGNIPWMNSGELNLKQVYNVENRITEEGLANSSTKYFPKHSILIGLAGQGKTRGTAAMNHIKLCTNQSIAAIYPSQKFDSFFLFYFIDSQYDELRKLSTGDGGRGGLNLSIINSVQIPLPPTLAEQKAIASALSDVDGLIASLEQLIEKKKAIKQGAMQELLTGKTRVKGFEGSGKFKYTEVGMIPEEWEVVNVGEVSEVVGGGTPSTRVSNYWNGNINWFTPTEISNIKYSSTSSRKITKDGLNNSSAKILPKGSILMTTRASIGELSILLNEACTNQGFQSLLALDMTYNEFLYYMMLSKKGELIKNASGSTFLEISPKKVKNIKIPFPQTLEEQKAIAQVLSDMDLEIEQLEEKKEKYGVIKVGMMQELLTGKTRLVFNG